MLVRLVRLGLLTALYVMLNTLVPPTYSRVHADGITCARLINVNVFQHDPSTLHGGYGLADAPVTEDINACIQLFLDGMENACRTACQNAGFYSGNYGVAFCYDYDSFVNYYPAPPYGVGTYNDYYSYPKDCGSF